MGHDSSAFHQLRHLSATEFPDSSTGPDLTGSGQALNPLGSALAKFRSLRDDTENAPSHIEIRISLGAVVSQHGKSPARIFLMLRQVIPEILDSLSAEDPAAIRSRKDLRRLNFVMGNDRWIRSIITKHTEPASKGILEIGAGEGDLLKTLASLGPVHGLDLLTGPDDSGLTWHQADLMDLEELPKGGILIANLFLHHFEDEALKKIGSLCRPFEVLVFSEPLRSRRILNLSRCITPLVGSVTRHDMPVSIRAGFTMGEIPDSLGLNKTDWHLEESKTALGAIRLVARKKP